MNRVKRKRFGLATQSDHASTRHPGQIRGADINCSDLPGRIKSFRWFPDVQLINQLPEVLRHAEPGCLYQIITTTRQLDLSLFPKAKNIYRSKAMLLTCSRTSEALICGEIALCDALAPG
jgi:hypothetical protein